MPHELDVYDFELPAVKDWLAGDNRTLAFQVVDGAGNPVDLTDATVAWRLFEREYQDDPEDAVLSGDDGTVELVTDSRVDSENGEWEVRLDTGATPDLYGEYYHRPEVIQSDGSQATWRGEVVVTA